MSWRMRVVHSTGFAYNAPVTSSYNEARLTPRSDARQNVIVNRVETVPATRAYRYTDYWGSAVTAFDLHAPHEELEVSGMSVVETEAGERPRPDQQRTWDQIRSENVMDRYDEMLSNTDYVPKNRTLAATVKRIAKGLPPHEPEPDGSAVLPPGTYVLPLSMRIPASDKLCVAGSFAALVASSSPAQARFFRVAALSPALHHVTRPPLSTR